MEIDAVLAALSHPIRREILWLVWDRELAAGELVARFDVAGPTISQHLRVLRTAGLVEQRREGTFRRYRARREVLGALRAMLEAPSVSANAVPAASDAGSISSRPATVIQGEVALPVPIEAAWRLWTDPEAGGWAGSELAIEPVAGGTFAMSIGGSGVAVRGVYREVVRPRLLSFEWSFADALVPLPSDPFVTTVRFGARGTGTQVELTQIVYTQTAAPLLEAAWADRLQRLVASCRAATGAGSGS